MIIADLRELGDAGRVAMHCTVVIGRVCVRDVPMAQLGMRAPRRVEAQAAAAVRCVAAPS